MKTIEQKVLKYIDRNNLITKGEKLLIALSGGPDSVFALYILKKFKDRFNISLGTVHVNHGLRGKSANEDEAFCKELSDRIGVQYFVVKIDVKKHAEEQKISVEEAARELRYLHLMKISKENSYDKIVTAHNLNDNAETVILNLVKGSGLNGIAGIPIKRGNIIRPLLSIKKQEIIDYLTHYKIKYRIDETNAVDIYERNYIRNQIIPAIKKINPSVEENLLNSSEIFRNSKSILDDYIESIRSEILSVSGKGIVVNLVNLKKYNPAVLGELLKNEIFKIFHLEFEFNDYIKIVSLLKNQTGKRIQLSEDVFVYKERASLVIQQAEIEKDFSAKIKTGEEIIFCGKIFNILQSSAEKVVYDDDKYHEFISADNIDDKEFVIRNWQTGDKFRPIGMKGFKKVSDFLTEQKIPTSERSKQLVLLNKDKIVWLPGYRIDDRYKITKSTKRIFELCLR